MTAVASRRGFLRGVATVSAIAGAAVAPAIVRAAPVADAELLRLGAELDRAGEAYLAACAAKAACVEHYERIKPEIPPEIIRAWNEPYLHHGEWPPNHDDAPDPRVAGKGNRIRLYDRYEVAESARRLDGRTRLGRRVRMLRAKLDAYHDSHDAARRAAGMPKSQERQFCAGRHVLDVGFAIAAVEATTMAGLAVKGRAGLAMHRVWADESPRRIEDSYNRLLRNLATIQGAELPLCA